MGGFALGDLGLGAGRHSWGLPLNTSPGKSVPMEWMFWQTHTSEKQESKMVLAGSRKIPGHGPESWLPESSAVRARGQAVTLALSGKILGWGNGSCPPCPWHPLLPRRDPPTHKGPSTGPTSKHLQQSKAAAGHSPPSPTAHTHMGLKHGCLIKFPFKITTIHTTTMVLGRGAATHM